MYSGKKYPAKKRLFPKNVESTSSDELIQKSSGKAGGLPNAEANARSPPGEFAAVLNSAPQITLDVFVFAKAALVQLNRPTIHPVGFLPNRLAECWPRAFFPVVVFHYISVFSLF